MQCLLLACKPQKTKEKMKRKQRERGVTLMGSIFPDLSVCLLYLYPPLTWMGVPRDYTTLINYYQQLFIRIVY